MSGGSPLTICLAGNPNCGKTTVFNALTGARQHVGNWPGVTVERKSGTLRWRGENVTVIDLPGVYSLGVTAQSSLDERVARDYILSGEADLVVNIVDAGNLERNLYLTAQILEMRVPMIVAVNMMDVARERRIDIDIDGIARRLGCPVVPLVAQRGEGIERLKAVIVEAGHRHVSPPVETAYDSEVEMAVGELLPLVSSVARARRLDPRWLALKLLEDDDGAKTLVDADILKAVADKQQHVAAATGEDLDILIADGRYGFANGLIHGLVHKRGTVTRTISDRIDRVVLHRFLGIPIFLVVMYLLFLFTINFGNAFVDFFDQAVGAVLVEGFGQWLTSLGSPAWLTTLLADGVGGGVQTVSTFIPIIGCLYLFLSFLEDSGYMARAAFVMDRLMRAVGLPGKSFIPLIVGFGCNVPAIMATRTLENRRDRVLTVMMAPFMSCGARLPVYALFAAAFFPTGGPTLVFALYLIGIGFAVMTGFVLKHTLLRGEAAPFVMELPPYHLPTLKGLLIRTWDRLKGFTLRAGKAIVAVVVVLSFFNSLGADGSFGNQNTGNSLLATAGKALTPALAPMGVTEDNWPATVGMITGIFAKEAVVGTLDALYTALATDAGGQAPPDQPFDLGQKLSAAVATIPTNLSALGNAITDPLGLRIADIHDAESAAAEQAVQAGTFGAMASRFDGQLGAFAYLLAVLLYMPCVSAMAAIVRETGWRWALFATAWTTGLGYGAAVLAYQAGRFAQAPAAAAPWIIGVLTAFIIALASFRVAGRRGLAPPATAAAE